MAVRADGPVPYAPRAAVLGIIDRYRDRGLQSPFTQDVLLRAGVSESLVPRTLQALKLLDLVDGEGVPTVHMEGLRRASTEEFPERLGDVLRASYADVFAYVDPAEDSIERISDAFRSYTPSGMRDRAVSLFIGLCERAGIRPEAARREPVPKSRSARSAAPARRTANGSTSTSRPAQSKRETFHSPDDLPPALLGLLRQLPKAWTKLDRDRFITAFEATLDYCVPQVPDQEKSLLDQHEEVPR